MAGTKDRYLLALPRGEGKVFLAWRLLGSDRPDMAFHVARRADGGDWQQLTAEAVTNSTNYLDTPGQIGECEYRIVDGDGAASESVRVDCGAEASCRVVDVPLVAPASGSWRIGLGDLDGDGRIDFVVPTLVDGEVVLFAYGHDGKSMWEFRTGLPDPELHGNIPFTVWDINGDGRAEVIVRRGGPRWAELLSAVREGMKPERTDHRTPIPSGDCIVALEGRTGEVLWEAPFEGHQRSMHMVSAHVNGIDKPAAVIFNVGTYEDVRTFAFDGLDGHLLWKVQQDRGGGHNIDAADIDGDGVQEVIVGGICYNGDGSIRWEAEPFGHTDISKPCRIDPSRDGMQVWYAVEGPPRELNGVYFVDSQGKTIFKEPYRHAHYGWIARHTSKVPGLQPHTAEDARYEYGAAQAGAREQGHFPIFLPDGSHWLNLTEWQRKNFVPVHWDAGPEVVFIIRKENKRVVRLLDTGQIEDVPDGKLPEGGQYGRNLGCADVIGDFRENIVTIDHQRQRLMVLANPTVCKARGYSPYDDFEYRHDRSRHGGGYYIYLSPPDRRVQN